MNVYYVSFFASLIDGVVSFPWPHLLSLFISPTVLPHLLCLLSWGQVLEESSLPPAQNQNPFLLVVSRGHVTKTLCICHPSPGQLGHPALLSAGCSGLPLFDSPLELLVACCQLQFSCLWWPCPGLSSLHYSARPAVYNYLLIFFLLEMVFRLALKNELSLTKFSNFSVFEATLIFLVLG